jgi:hypothetical protein
MKNLILFFLLMSLSSCKVGRFVVYNFADINQEILRKELLNSNSLLRKKEKYQKRSCNTVGLQKISFTHHHP